MAEKKTNVHATHLLIDEKLVGKGVSTVEEGQDAKSVPDAEPVQAAVSERQHWADDGQGAGAADRGLSARGLSQRSGSGIQMLVIGVSLWLRVACIDTNLVNILS